MAAILNIDDFTSIGHTVGTFRGPTNLRLWVRNSLGIYLFRGASGISETTIINEIIQME
jgi:hypothetical protein